ncbi:MAG: serine/threonine-protein kinase [Byssovorax sp.]
MASIQDTTAANPAANHYHEGQILGGKYELISKAGEGATGAVWIALNTSLQSKVAIKLVHPEMRLPVIVERVMREARAAARLTHSAIVRVFDLGETPNGDPYIVMELLEGESLRSMLDRKVRLTPEEALSVLLPLASAMHLAHEEGIIHRDIKPDNIMLARIDGGRIQPKLVDFGIAKLSFGDPGGVNTGALVIGTPGYMSPEQAGGGESVDHRTDIWSFSALLYEMVSGDTPFPSVNTLEALCAVIRDPVPSLLGERVKDAALWAIIERGLKKDPKERWSSMRDVGEALTDWLASRGVAEDVSGVPLRALWLGAPPSRRMVEAPRPLAGAGGRRIDSPFRARSEEPVVAPSALFSEVSGVPAPKSPRSRYAVMAGLALLTGALAWKIAFSSVAAPTHAASVDAAPPAAAMTAAAAPPPPAAAPEPPPPAPTPVTSAAIVAPAAVSAAPIPTHVAPKSTTAKWGKVPAKPAVIATATPVAPPAPASSDGTKHTWSAPPGAVDAGAAPLASPPATPPVSAPTAPASNSRDTIDGV